MKIAIIGAGTIGRAIAERLAKARVGEIYATKRRTEAIKDLEKLGIKISSDNRAAAAWADVVIICVKPRDVPRVLEEVSDEVRNKLVISVAAAVPMDLLEASRSQPTPWEVGLQRKMKALPARSSKRWAHRSKSTKSIWTL